MLASFVLRLIGVGLLFLLGFVIEQICPADRSKSTSRRLNTGHAILFEIIDVTLGAWVGIAVGNVVSKLPFAGLIALPASDKGKLLLAVPLVALGVAIGDFFYYWFHRLQHSSVWLWAQHEVHHSDESINITSTLRHHWLERPLLSLFVTAPMVILFKLPAISIPPVALVGMLPGYFVHLNSHIRFGWLNFFFACPQSHRIHHSKLPEHIDKNFAVSFAIWDVIFGTYYHPAKDEWPSTGLASGIKVSSISEAVVMPFMTWHQMIKAKLQPNGLARPPQHRR